MVQRRFFFLCFCLPAMGGSVPAEETANLLPNPGFEAASADGLATGWAWGVYRGQGRIALSDETAHSGRLSLLMSSIRGGVGQCYVVKPVPVDPKTAYRVDAWVRTNVGRAQIQIRWRNREKGLPEQVAINFFKLQPGRWYQLSALPAKNWNIYHTLGKKNRPARLNPEGLYFPGTKEVRLYLFTRPDGVVSYDDIFLGPASREKPGESAIEKEALAEYHRLLLDREPAPYPKADLAKKVVIETPEFSKHFRLDPAFQPHGITIRDGCFYRKGRHVFFLGCESGAPRPGIMKLLGFKVHAVTGTSTYDNNWTRTTDKGDHILVQYGEAVPLAPKIRDSIRFGFLPIVQTINHAKACPLARAGRPDLVVDRGHFIAYCPDQPESRQLRANFWRSLLAACRPYPILGYEHFNELGYLCYCKPSRDLFKKHMEEKYQSIGKANRTWGTQFSSFAEADPPYRKGSNTAEHILPEGFSRPMWADWLRFTEDHFGEVMQRLMRFSRDWDSRKNHFRCIQSHFNLRLDYGGIGVNPARKARVEDMFGAEVGQTFFPQRAGQEDPEQVKASFVGLPFQGGIIRGLTERLPVVNLEGGIRRAQLSFSTAAMDAISLLPVQGQWKLQIDPEKLGLKERWFAGDFKDEDWKSVPITDVWDKHGHAEYDGWGWYRKKIQVPAELKGKRLWFNGKGLDDSGTLYINGQKIGSASGWNRSFSFDISAALRYGAENTFAIQIVDTGLYGGLRFFLGVNDFDLLQPRPATRGMMRMYLWNHVLHGFDVSSLSYFYSPEGNPGALFSPYKCGLPAIKAIAESEADIRAVSEIVLPKPRIRGQAAILYPLETFRAAVPNTVKEMIDYHGTRDFLQYMVPLFCSDAQVDVLLTKHILEGRLSKYPVLFLRGYERVPPGVIARLEKYVRKGGTLVTDYASLRTDDEWHTPLDTSGLTGVVFKELRKDTFQVGDWKTLPRQGNGVTGAELEFRGAVPWIVTREGTPAVTVHALGKGRVFAVAAELDYDGVAGLVARILHETRIEPLIRVRRANGERFRFVESHLLGRRGRYVATIQNYGAGEELAQIALPRLPRGTYRIRDIDTRQWLEQPGGGREWSSDTIRNGFTTTLRPLDPLVLLIESIRKKLTPLPGISPERSAAIDRLWDNAEDFHTRVLFEANYGAGYGRVDIPSTDLFTARQMLVGAGYRWELALSPYARNRGRIKCFDGRKIEERSLQDFGVLVIPAIHLWAHRWPKEEIEAVKSFVRKGGGALFLGRSFDRYGNWNLLREFSIRDTSDLIMDPAHCVDDEPYYVTYTDIAPHPATRGVKTFQSRGGSHINAGEGCQVLIRAPRGAVTRSGKVEAPTLCVVRKYGKGHIAVMGDDRWLDPEFLKQADNAKLWMGLVKWLAGRE